MTARWYWGARRISAGGAAEVILASQHGASGFERLVVVKRVLPHLRHDQSLARMFLDEARLGAALRHPNIVDIYDIRPGNDRCEVVMEYLSGEDLGVVLAELSHAEARMPIPFVLRVAADVADALAAAHDGTDATGKPRCVIHSAVNPSNIIVTYDGITKLVDFGFARAAAEIVDVRLQGSLPYISPEQVEGKVVDKRSDLFSLGATMHQMLTSRRLFSGPSRQAILNNVLQRRIPPPSVYNPNVSPALDRVVLQLLARNPAQRPRSAAALRNALEELIFQEGVGSDRELGQWLQKALAERFALRRAAERQVVMQARTPRTPMEDEDDLPLLFAHLPRREAAASPTTLVNPSPVRASMTRSGPHSTGLHLAQVPAIKQPSGFPRPLAASLVSLSVLALLGGAYLYGKSRHRGEATPGAWTAVSATPTVTPFEAPPPAVGTVHAAADVEAVDLLVHVLPAGATVTVDGVVALEAASPHGLLIPVSPGKVMVLRVAKEGYIAHEATLRAPTAGTMPIYINLAPREEIEEEFIPAPRATSRPAVADVAENKGSTEPAGEPEARLAEEHEAQEVVASADAALPTPPSLPALDVPPVADPGAVTGENSDTGTESLAAAAGAAHGLGAHGAHLAPAFGRVDVRSSPPGATVSIGGRVKGRTPLVGLMLKAGEPIEVELSLSGRETHRRRVVPRLGVTETINAELRVNGAAAPPRPIEVPSSWLEGRRIAGNRKVQPPRSVLLLMSRRNQREARVKVRVCVKRSGKVESAAVLSSSGYKAYDDKLVAEMGAWTFRPHDRDSAVCTTMTYVVKNI